MAYVVGKKVTRDGNEFDSFAFGLQLPQQSGKPFSQNYTSFEQAKSNLLNLLQTQKGERLMQPQFGTGLHSLLFEQMDDQEFEVSIQQVITENVNYWLPYIRIQDIEVEYTDENKDRNQAKLKIQFSVGNEIDTDEITFTING